MIPRLLLLSFMLTPFLSAGATQDDPKAAAHTAMIAGVQAFGQANYEEAVARFEQAVTLDPDFVTAHLYLATAYAQTFVPGIDTPKNVLWATKALNQYREVLRRNPSDIYSLKSIASLELQLKNLNQAKESYQKAIAADPGDPELFYAVGVVDWYMAYRAVAVEKAKLPEESRRAVALKNAKLPEKSQGSFFLSGRCADARTAALANLDDGVAMFTKAVSLRQDYDYAMGYLTQLYRLRADLDCGNKDAHAADMKQADEWIDMATAARRRKAEAVIKSGQGLIDVPPPR
jgi:tetratricopeptide (TPR) repeat protein